MKNEGTFCVREKTKCGFADEKHATWLGVGEREERLWENPAQVEVSPSLKM